jgi:hypothetical protein
MMRGERSGEKIANTWDSYSRRKTGGMMERWMASLLSPSEKVQYADAPRVCTRRLHPPATSPLRYIYEGHQTSRLLLAF